MADTEDFRAGQRVRIKASADSEFRGYTGVIMHVGTKVCDVRIRYKPKGSKVRSTYIGTFRKDELERPNRKPLDLAVFAPGEERGAHRGGIAVGCGVLLLIAVLVGTYFLH